MVVHRKSFSYKPYCLPVPLAFPVRRDFPPFSSYFDQFDEPKIRNQRKFPVHFRRKMYELCAVEVVTINFPLVFLQRLYTHNLPKWNDVEVWDNCPNRHCMENRCWWWIVIFEQRKTLQALIWRSISFDSTIRLVVPDRVMNKINVFQCYRTFAKTISLSVPQHFLNESSQ